MFFTALVTTDVPCAHLRPHDACAQLPVWQRSLSHLRSIAFAGVPFDPTTSSGHIFVELFAPPTTPRVRLSLDAHGGGGVTATLRLDAAALADAPSADALYRTAQTACSPQPRWDVDPTCMHRTAGTLRSVLLVLRQAAPRTRACAPPTPPASWPPPMPSPSPPPASLPASLPPTPPSRIVWRRIVRLSELVHVAAPLAAVRSLLPVHGGALLLQLGEREGVLAFAADLQPLLAAGAIEKHLASGGASAATDGGASADADAAKHSDGIGRGDSSGGGGDAALSDLLTAQERWVSAVMRLEEALTAARAENQKAREAVEARLDARATSLARRITLRSRTASLASLREAAAVAEAEVRTEQRRVSEMRDALNAARSGVEEAAAARHATESSAAAECEAVTPAVASLEHVRLREARLRRQLLAALSEVLPVGRPPPAAAAPPALPPAAGGATLPCSAAVVGSAGGGGSSAHKPDASVAAASTPPPPSSTYASSTYASGGGGSANGGPPAYAVCTAGWSPLAMASGAAADEEDVAAVLGGAAQLAVNVARLLDVTLRYPLRLAGSRSSIEDPPHVIAVNGGGAPAAALAGGFAGGPLSGSFAASMVRGSGSGSGLLGSAVAAKSSNFPLYARGSEPQRLQHALMLLCRNVHQLLHALGEMHNVQATWHNQPDMHARSPLTRSECLTP